MYFWVEDQSDYFDSDLENPRNKERKIEREKLQPIEGAAIAKLYLRLKNHVISALLLIFTGWASDTTPLCRNYFIFLISDLNHILKCLVRKFKVVETYFMQDFSSDEEEIINKIERKILLACMVHALLFFNENCLSCWGSL